MLPTPSPAALALNLAQRWRSAWAALASETASALPAMAELAELAWARGDVAAAASAAGAAVLMEHLQAARYRLAPRMLTILAAVGADRVAVSADSLPALAGAAIAHDYGVLPTWPAADIALLRERAQAAPPDIALALACALGEVCERNGLDAEFAALQAQLAAVAHQPEVAPFWRGHWAIVCAWHLASFGHWSAAREALRGAEALATAHGLAHLHANATLQRARLVESKLDPAAALRLAEQATADTDPQALPLRLADLADVRCRVAMQRLDFHTAVAEARRAAGYAQAANVWPGYLATYAAHEAYGLLGTGADAEALACLDRVRDVQTPRYLAERALVLRDLAQLAATERRGHWSAAAQAQLAQVLRRLRELEWFAVLPALPDLLARLFARALAAGLETDWVRAAIRFRGLKAPPDAPHVWPWPVMVRLLGDFTVLTQSGPLSANAQQPPRKAAGKPLELLRLLATHGHAAVLVDDVAASLWPGDGREGRQKAFDITAARLRRLLGDDEAVVVHDRRVRLGAQSVWVDVHALDRRLSQADAAADDAAFGEAIDAALALYRGPCLPDSREPWAERARERIRARLAASLLRAVGPADAGQRAARIRSLQAAAVDPALANLLRGNGP